jgi:hypothetical protein
VDCAPIPKEDEELARRVIGAAIEVHRLLGPERAQRNNQWTTRRFAMKIRTGPRSAAIEVDCLLCVLRVLCG